MPGVYGYTGAGTYGEVNSVVGLKSVQQLTLSGQIWDIRGMTEVYNLLTVGNPNDH